MSTKTTAMGWMTVALLAGALTLPGLAQADRGGGYDRDGGYGYGNQWEHRENRGHRRHHDHGHHGHRGHWDRDRRVVVVSGTRLYGAPPGICAPVDQSRQRPYGHIAQ
jgi:hypothetical protein